MQRQDLIAQLNRIKDQHEQDATRHEQDAAYERDYAAAIEEALALATHTNSAYDLRDNYRYTADAYDRMINEGTIGPAMATHEAVRDAYIEAYETTRAVYAI